MDIRNWLQKWLSIHDLHQQVAQLDKRMGEVEQHVTSILQHFGNYQNRTDAELNLMRSQLQTMLATVANVIENAQIESDRKRAISLRARLRNNLTRVTKAITGDYNSGADSVYQYE